MELIDVVRRWVAAAAERQRTIPFGRAATDEANFMVSWFGYYHLTGDPLVSETAEALFDSFHKWLQTEAHRGYYARQEAHHGTEPFIFFPTRLYQLGRRTDDYLGEWARRILARDEGFVVLMPEDLLQGEHAHLERAREAQESGDIPMQVEWHVAGGKTQVEAD